MADNVPITAGTGTSIATDDDGTAHHQYFKVEWGPDNTYNKVDTASGKPLPIQVRSASGLIPLGEPTDAAATATDTTSVSVVSILKQLSASLQTLAAVGNAKGFKAEDVAFSDGDWGMPAYAKRTASPANTSGTDGDWEPIQVSGGYAWFHDNKGLSNLAFVATFTTLTRPANTTAYAASDSISDNATAGSVTALSATISDVNDDPVFIADILINSTDTGLAGKKLRANLFNADPTSSSGVGAGDNAAYSQKKNGYIGTFVGTMETGFSDGSVGRLVPSFRDTNYSPAGGFVVAKPTSGARTLYIQFIAEEAFTPSANSTTIIAAARGWQARAV